MRIESSKMIEAIPKKENICAVIVTFQPDGTFPDCLARIEKQVDRVVIVDNNSNASTVARLHDLPSRLNVELILNDQNLGVAIALNQGVNKAKEHGYPWVLLLDQDTDPLDSMVETLAHVYVNFKQKDKLAVIGSNYWDRTTHQVRYAIESRGESKSVAQKTVITSGSLVTMVAFEAVGGFRDGFFIDHVDHEYCLRAAEKGFKVIMTCEPIMTHNLGAPTTHRLPWRTTGTSNHSPIRWYYMTRNHIILAREYLFKEPAWVIGTSWSRLKSLILMIAFEHDKISKLKYVGLGISHGLRGKLGKFQ